MACIEVQWGISDSDMMITWRGSVSSLGTDWAQARAGPLRERDDFKQFVKELEADEQE